MLTGVEDNHAAYMETTDPPGQDIDSILEEKRRMSSLQAVDSYHQSKRSYLLAQDRC